MRKAAAFRCGDSGTGRLVGRDCPDPAIAACCRQRAAEVRGGLPATPRRAGHAQLNADDVNAWLDGYMPYAIGARRHPRRGRRGGQGRPGPDRARVRLCRRRQERKVDPETTLFRPGSISKLFTWTAVMQQVEQGKLDLDADVNKYIDFKIPPYEGKPITLRNIMTHTPGFEEQVKDLITRRCRTSTFPTTDPEALGAEAGLRARARRRPIRTMAPAWPATSSSACRASRSTLTSSSTSSRRSG